MSAAEEAASRIWLVLDMLACTQPELPLKDAVHLARETYKKVDWTGQFNPPADLGTDAGLGALTEFDMRDRARFGAWLGTQRDVVELILDTRKINAIKKARDLTGSGLKEAKEAVEWLSDHPELISPAVRRLL